MEVINEVQITWVSRDNIVELHWRGRELVRTVGVDRRLAVLDLVKELRELKAPRGLRCELAYRIVGLMLVLIVGVCAVCSS